MNSDPLELFHEWVQGDEMVIATATADGRPSARALLLKSADERGFTFFTGYTSRKGRELEANPTRGAALPPRRDPGARRGPRRAHPARRSPTRTGARGPPASRRSAAASHQSEPIGSREELEAAVAAQPEEPERPERWGGYRLVPDVYEFWRHRDDRLHERHLFRACDDGWEQLLLQP